MKIRRYLAGAVLTALLAAPLAACGSSSNGGSHATAATQSAVTHIDALQAKQLLGTTTNAVSVLDVRTPAEFAAGHIADASNIDFYASSFRDQIARLDKAKTYLVYCHSGNRSGQATTMMAALGFTHVYDVVGGITALQEAGVALVN